MLNRFVDLKIKWCSIFLYGNGKLIPHAKFYLHYQVRICSLLKRYAKRVKRCETNAYTCGSVIAETHLELTETSDISEDHEPITAERLQLDLKPIIFNNTDFGMGALIAIKDVRIINFTGVGVG